MKASARRLPKVMVPVLSRSRVSTSPAASTARPEVAITLKRTSRSMPAMPIADSKPPIVIARMDPLVSFNVIRSEEHTYELQSRMPSSYDVSYSHHQHDIGIQINHNHNTQ